MALGDDGLHGLGLDGQVLAQAVSQFAGADGVGVAALGDFTGHLYPDVLPALEKWRAQGIDLYVYSSGSVAAQKLLFGYSDEGDITHLFSGYFDTHIGAKREVQSYQNIAAQTGIAPSQILFLSDIHQELDAAEQAGFRTLQLIRGDDDGASHHHQVHQFDEINPEQIPS